MSYQLRDADVKIIMAQVSLCANVKQALAKLKKQIPIIAIKEKVRNYSFNEHISHSLRYEGRVKISRPSTQLALLSIQFLFYYIETNVRKTSDQFFIDRTNSFILNWNTVPSIFLRRHDICMVSR